jgi:riboflavin synthase
MFTGIVENLGIIKKIQKRPNLAAVAVQSSRLTRGIKKGDSVAVNGICLTVSAKQEGLLNFDVMKETLARTTLKSWEVGQKVNLERALPAQGRFSGHFVTGHIDGVGKVQKKITGKNYVEFEIAVPAELMRYMLLKGSVSLDGVSLTIGKVGKNFISVHLIPYTLKVTNFGTKRNGDLVNIEADILAKYILAPRPKARR